MKNRDRKIGELADRLVQREVYYCVSSLMSSISQIMWDCKGFEDAFGDSPDDLIGLYAQDDWEEPGRYFILEDADFDELESIANQYGDWDDLLTRMGVPDEIANPTHWVCADCLSPIVNGDFTGLDYGRTPDNEEVIEALHEKVREGVENFDGGHPMGEEYDEEFSTAQCDCCGTTLAGARYAFSDGSDMDDVAENRVKWVAAFTGVDVERKIREEICELVDAEACGWQQVGEEYNLDADQTEVYEHWIVSNWLARRLEEKGRITGEFAGLTIWGRSTTGQMISMDYVIQQIAAELWAEELAEVKEDSE